ncbi:PQQ-binding-like beta-propeller repeat protein [Streptomyces sp. H51]|uniref:outer membrane protein assembly factor BamB family protein n=1 Tax=Streptomyces sp. H51 TaxID=3111770 RepID=UPI002D79E2C7|nr:PQQ-binding-like beta-propeller repeat protein [Streptomyces sp. H51]
MPNEDRITRIVHRPGHGILAADVRGALHWFDADLNRVRSSSSSVAAQDPAGDPVYAIAFTDDAVVTRDKIGNISRWDLDSLALTDRLDARATADRALLLEGEQPSPTMLRGVGVWDGKAYLDNGYFQLVVIDLATFTVDRIVPWPHGYDMLEWFCTDAPGIHAVSDRHGRIHLGSLDDLAFPTVVEIDTSNVHRVLYDERHQRFWATTDAGIGDHYKIANGVVTVRLDGTVEQRLDFARNDVEGLAFSSDFSRAYCGGFDGELLIFDNSAPELTVADRVRGFPHQIIDVTVGDGDRVYVLTQDGEVTALGPDGRHIGSLRYARQCVWDLQPLPGDGPSLLAATDDGTARLRLVEPAPGHPSLRVTDRYVSGLGFTRRVTVADDGWAGVFWPSTVRRVSGGGETLWERELPGIVHTLAQSPDGTRLLVACNGGGIEFDAATGAETGRIEDLPASAWASAYLLDGRRLLATRNGLMNAYAADSTATWTAELGNYPKRLIVEGDRVRATGGGGIKEFEVGGDKIDQRYSELLDNTTENCAVIEGTVCAITYGMQIAAYDQESGELLALHEDLPDFPKGMAAVRGPHGDPYVVVGGRGGYVRLYRLDRSGGAEVLTAVRDLWLPGSPVDVTVTRP